jgi:hypothetical protein
MLIFIFPVVSSDKISYRLLEFQTSGMMGCELSKTDKHLVYILTLGVIKSYRRLGIGIQYILLSLYVLFISTVDNLGFFLLQRHH